MVRFFYVKYTEMLSFFLVAEALTGLIYHRPLDENSSFHTLPDDGRSISRNVAEKYEDSRHDKLRKQYEYNWIHKHKHIQENNVVPVSYLK